MGRNQIKGLTKGILRKNMGSRMFVYAILLLFFMGDILRSMINTSEKIIQVFQAFPYTAIGFGLSIIVILHMISESGRQEDLAFIPQTKKTRFWANTLAYFITLCQVQMVGLILYFLQYGIQMVINFTYEGSWMYYQVNMLEIVGGLVWYLVMGMSIVSVVFIFYEWCKRSFISFVVGMVSILVGTLSLLYSEWFDSKAIKDFLTAEEVSYCLIVFTLLFFTIVTFGIAYFITCNRSVGESKLLRKKTVKQYVWLISSLCYLCLTLIMVLTIFNSYDKVDRNNSILEGKKTVIYVGERTEPRRTYRVNPIPVLEDVSYSSMKVEDMEAEVRGLSREDSKKITEDSVILSYYFITHLFEYEIQDKLNISVKSEITQDRSINIYIEHSSYRLSGVTPYLGMSWFYPSSAKCYDLNEVKSYEESGTWGGSIDVYSEDMLY